MQDEATKVCGRCGQRLPLSGFHRNRAKRDGRATECKQCRSVLDKAAYTTSPARRAYQLNQGRAWAQQHPARSRGIKRRSYLANRERYLADAAARYRQDPDAMKRRAAAWAAANPDRILEYQRHRRAAKKSRSLGVITAEQLAAKFAFWGDRCWMCGAPATEPDHVKPLNRGGLHVLANIRPACKPCNSAKRDRWPFPVRGSASARLSGRRLP